MTRNTAAPSPHLKPSALSISLKLVQSAVNSDAAAVPIVAVIAVPLVATLVGVPNFVLLLMLLVLVMSLLPMFLFLFLLLQLLLSYLLLLLLL